MTSTWRLGYRPELDGLRGVAVALVFLNHAGVPGVPFGAPLGCDVFFVLSGFLITTLLLEERDVQGRISLKAFYARRALRLLPALAVFVLIIDVLAAVHPVDGWDGVGSGSLWTALYGLNWATYARSHVAPFAHLWSLSIEEQFYVGWGLVLLLVARFSSRAPALLATLALCAASLALRWIWWSHTGFGVYSRLYYGTDSRVLSPLLGAALAIGVGWPVVRSLARRLAVPLLGLGLAALALSVHGRGPIDNNPWHFGYLIPELATVAILAGVVFRQTFVNRLLGHPAVVHLGRRSYAFYLWHVPILSWFAVNGRPPWPQKVLALALALLAAELSMRFVERPFLDLKHRFGRTPSQAATAPGHR